MPANSSAPAQQAPPLLPSNSHPARQGTPVNHQTSSMDVMRWVDHWVGSPLCFMLGLLLTFLRRILPDRSRRISGDRSLAVFKFFGLGSIIEATPLLHAMRQRYPQSRLICVTFDHNEHLLRRLDVCTDLRIIRTGSPGRFILDVASLLVWLWRQRIEAVVDLEFFSKFSTLLAFFSGARVRVGFHLNDFWRYSLVTHPIYFNYYRHITDIYRDAARRLGVAIDDTHLPRLDPGDAARRSAGELLKRHGWSGNGLLLGVNVNVGELCFERRWPIERFGAVIARLLEGHADLRVVLTGSRQERGYTMSLLDHLPASLHERVIVTAGSWSFDEFIAGLSLFNAYLTNDSGPMHLAAAQGVPLVSLWGPGRPDFYAPRCPHHRVIYCDYPCSPCLYMFTTFQGMWCNHEGWCMEAIEPPVVLEAVEAILAQTSTPASAPREP